MLVIGALGATDVMVRIDAVRYVSWVLAIVAAVAACALAVVASEHAARVASAEQNARRWQIQAVASAAITFMLMAGLPEGEADDPLRWALVIAAAVALVGLATTYRDRSRPGVSSLSLALDATVIGFTVVLICLTLIEHPRVQGAATLLAAFGAAGYAVFIATRGSAAEHPRGPDALLLSGVLVLCLHAAGQAAYQLGLVVPAAFGVPGVALVGCAALAQSAWLGSHEAAPKPPPPARESRVRFAPAAAAGIAILLLSIAELAGRGSRTGFFGVILLFGLIVSRLVITLVDNKQLLQRVEYSGVFEDKLRDVGAALVGAIDSREVLQLVCRTAQVSLRADSVILWMIDTSTQELEAVEVLSAKRRSLLRRRLSLKDETSLAARVARTGQTEIVSDVATANLSNGFLNVLLRAQSLLAVPIHRGEAVQGVLVCVDSHTPTAYGPREQSKAELLASQVAVALDNAYQHALQRRRLEELSALYQFAQSAHAGRTGADIIKELLPIAKEHVKYTYGSIWLRDDGNGSALRMIAADGPGGRSGGSGRPSSVAMRALTTGEPAHAGLDWSDRDASVVPERPGVHAQLAVPLVHKRHVLGMIDLESRYLNAYSLNEERLLVALAHHAALAIENVHLLEDARKVEALKELDRMKTELLSTVSHELRTPLGSIKGYATTMLTHGSKLKRDEQREFLQIIDSEADRLRELIENLLDLSRLEAGVLRIDRESARLSGVVRDVARKVQLAAPSHTIEIDWPEDDPAVNADPKRIYQVIQNLLTNAIKYSPNGGKVRLSGVASAKHLTISVRDEGDGLPAGQLARIFERFHRVENSATRQIGGTGLGLAICKGLVEAHGGRIWAESDGVGSGSTFRFTLPLLPEPGGMTSSPNRTKGAHDHQQEIHRPRR